LRHRRVQTLEDRLRHFLPRGTFAYAFDVIQRVVQRGMTEFPKRRPVRRV
jgi:hypothetical protein